MTEVSPTPDSSDAVEAMARARPYRAVPSTSSFSTDWEVQREYACINGLAAWFTVAAMHEPGAEEVGYSDGAIGSAQERAGQIAAALNAAEDRAKVWAASRLRFRIDAAGERGADGFSISLRLAREIARVLEPTTNRVNTAVFNPPGDTGRPLPGGDAGPGPSDVVASTEPGSVELGLVLRVPATNEVAEALRASYERMQVALATARNEAAAAAYEDAAWRIDNFARVLDLANGRSTVRSQFVWAMSNDFREAATQHRAAAQPKGSLVSIETRVDDQQGGLSCTGEDQSRAQREGGWA